MFVFLSHLLATMIGMVTGMKKKLWIGAMLLMLLMICCSATVSAKSVVRTEKKTLYYGQTLTLKFSEKAKWSTTNKKIVPVKQKRNGKSAVLKAKKAGTATITVKLKCLFLLLLSIIWFIIGHNRVEFSKGKRI